jgi:hypothetical protein
MADEKKAGQADTDIASSSDLLNDYIHAPTGGLWFALAGLIALAAAAGFWLTKTGVPIWGLLFK